MEDVTYTLEFEKPLRELEKQLITLNQVSQESKVDVSSEIAAIEKKIDQMKVDIYSDLTAWQRVQLSRHPKRPYTLDYIERVFTDFEELHGDRVVDAVVVPAHADVHRTAPAVAEVELGVAVAHVQRLGLRARHLAEGGHELQRRRVPLMAQGAPVSAARGARRGARARTP